MNEGSLIVCNLTVYSLIPPIITCNLMSLQAFVYNILSQRSFCVEQNQYGVEIIKDALQEGVCYGHGLL